MTASPLPRLGALLLLLAASLPPATAAPRPDPLDPQAPVPPIRHRSAVAEHRSPVVLPLDWRQSSERLRAESAARHGHCHPPADAQDAHRPPAAPQAPAAGPGHHGHHGHPGHHAHPGPTGPQSGQAGRTAAPPPLPLPAVPPAVQAPVRPPLPAAPGEHRHAH